jgi:hypothetical protein
MRFRLLLILPLLLCLSLVGQDAALKDSFVQAKALWSTQGDREGATARFDAIVATLAPKVPHLEPEWVQTLCESYNWLAILDDRSPQNKPRAQVRFQALIALNPDFDVDRTLTSQRLAALFDRLKSEKFAQLNLTYSPENGQLAVDGTPCPALPKKFLPFGVHKLTYTRPGHTPAELSVELGPRDVKSADFKLTRIASTITFHVQPSGTEVLLDGKSLGIAGGKAGPEAAPMSVPLGLRPEDLSAAFIIPELTPGKHHLELRNPCYRTKLISLGEDLTTPPADHTLQPFRLDPSKGTLTVRSAWPGGELMLSGQSRGPLPMIDLPVCSGTYDLLVKFPGGGYSQRITVEEGKALTLEARPKPRLAFLGLEGGEFTGRARFLTQLESLGDRLQTLAYLAPRPGEASKDALARLKASREAELFLMAIPVPGPVIHQVELILTSLDGEEDRVIVKPLEQDPLASLAMRLNAPLRVQRPGLGLSLLDVPGQAGPWVLDASDVAQKMGVQIGQPLEQVDGKPVATTQAVRQVLETAKGSLSVSQGGNAITLPLQMDAVEIPLGSPELSYPAVLAQLRLQYMGAKGDEANLIKLNQALALMQFRKYDKAIELLRDAHLTTTHGVCQGTIDYHTGNCFLRLGSAYQSEAAQAFRQALKYPQATLLGPEGPLVAPLAKQALEDLK